jgi:hypothetical protein
LHRLMLERDAHTNAYQSVHEDPSLVSYYVKLYLCHHVYERRQVKP